MPPTAERSRAGIKHAIHRFSVHRFAILRIAPLQVLVGVVANVEVPLHGSVFRSKGVKGGNVVVFGQAVYARHLARIAARLEQDHPLPSFR